MKKTTKRLGSQRVGQSDLKLLSGKLKQKIADMAVQEEIFASLRVELTNKVEAAARKCTNAVQHTVAIEPLKRRVAELEVKVARLLETKPTTLSRSRLCGIHSAPKTELLVQVAANALRDGGLIAAVDAILEACGLEPNG